MTGVISHITYMSLAGMQQTQRGEGRQNLDETVCESSLCCTRTYCICKVSVIMEIKVQRKKKRKKAGIFQGNNVEAPWCFTGETGFCFSKTLPLRSCISAVSTRSTCGDVFPYLLSFGGWFITVANLCKNKELHILFWGTQWKACARLIKK